MSFLTKPLAKLTEWATHPHKKYVYTFSEGSFADKVLLGAKGANLCEMNNLKLPVPPGLIITSEACIEYLNGEDVACKGEAKAKSLSPHLIEEYTKSIRELERQTGRLFGAYPHPTDDPNRTRRHHDSFPLLLSVRSATCVSMPRVDTILNLGINDAVVYQIARISKNARFAFDTYRRFIQMFGVVVLGVHKSKYEDILADIRNRSGVAHDDELTHGDLEMVVERFKNVAAIPMDPWDQLQMAIANIFNSWFHPRTMTFRDIHGIPNNLGNACILQCMVYGNMNSRSGTGVCFTRNPSTGEKAFFGEYLPNAEGKEVLSDARNPWCLYDLLREHPSIYETLLKIERQLEGHYRDMQDVEFTVESGNLYILNTKTGKRTAQASIRIAVELAREGIITERDAVLRVDANRMHYSLQPIIDPSVNVGTSFHEKVFSEESDSKCLENYSSKKICRGLAASAGAAVGEIVFSCEEVKARATSGRPIILCVADPDSIDMTAFQACEGLLTVRGTMFSQAAVLARSFSKCAIVGANTSTEGFLVDLTQKIMTCACGKVIKEGEIITLDGTHGVVYFGEIPTVSAKNDVDFRTMISWADKFKRMHILAETNSAADIQAANELGAEGIGLCRTEFMFLKPETLSLMQSVMLSRDTTERRACLDKILPLHKRDILQVFREMRNRPVTIRLLYPPLQDFFPMIGDTTYEQDIQVIAEHLGIDTTECHRRADDIPQTTPLLGLRGCRVSIMFPEITEMQTKAIIGAALEVFQEGIVVMPEILIPLVCSDHEIECILPMIHSVAAAMFVDAGFSLKYTVGCTLEVPRACVRAESIAAELGVGFVTLDTSKLTEMMYGFSPEDSAKFLEVYMDKHILADDPFGTIDKRGVGALVNTAVKKCRKANPKLKIGVCGSHGGDPSSVQYFDAIGLDFVSCFPRDVTAVKIAAAQAHIEMIRRKEEMEETQFWNMMEAMG